MKTCKDCSHCDVCATVRHNGEDRILANSPCKNFLPNTNVAGKIFEEFKGILFQLAYLGADGNYHIRKTSARDATAIVDEYFELKRKYAGGQE